MPADPDDRTLLQAIRAYCAAQASRPWPLTAEAQARRRAYADVARAAGDLLAEPEESSHDALLISACGV
jgi:hypothetical protein